ncbi:MAG TPA: DUF2844 domain-containing protein [Candidatus Acidoferrales bacterium]|nr:DUF2844 domain-containing protein [Candidatus Acidoferrales bacterium]
MRRILIASATFIGAMIVILTVPFSARASLGGSAVSVIADQAHMQGKLMRTAKSAYTVQEIQAPTGVVVREYVSQSGMVFAVAWQGPTQPDLRQVLGTYFTTFTQAVQAQRATRVARGPLVIKQPGLVVEIGGHMRWFVGRAYVPGMVPVGVALEEIR